MRTLINLKLSDDQMNDIIGYLYNKFELTVKARTTQVDDKYKRWQDNYAGKPAEKIRTTPFYNASNFVPQLIRMHTDILSARIIAFIMACKPFWRPKTMLGQAPHDYLEAIGTWLDYVSFYELGMYDLLDKTIFGTVKTGTVTLKAPWVEDTVYDVNSDPGTGARTEKEVRREGMQPRVIPFDDFFPYPIVANNLEEVQIKFHRLRLTKEEVESRVRANLWDEANAKRLLDFPENSSERVAHESQATEAGITLTSDVDRPYTAVEAWFEFPIGARNYRQVVVFNPKIQTKEGFLRGYFNNYPVGLDPFVDFRIMPREDLYYGYCIPEILEQSQEEQAQIHNVRRDASVICNVPTFKTKRYADVPNPSSEWYPGKLFVLENMDDLDVLNVPTKYQPMVDEEKFLMDLAERYSGVSPPMQGMGAGVLSGRRGIYNTGGTLALISEGNRRLDIYLKRLRFSFHKFGNLIYHSHRTFKPQGQEYQSWGTTGSNLTKTFQFLESEGYKGLFFEISASDASVNKENDRTALMMVANVMASYYQRMVEAANVICQTPQGHPLQQVLFQVVEGARDLASRLLFAFDVGDRDKLVPDLQAILSGKPPAGSQQMGQGNMPGAQGPVSVENLAALQQQLAGSQGGLPGPAGPM